MVRACKGDAFIAVLFFQPWDSLSVWRVMLGSIGEVLAPEGFVGSIQVDRGDQ